MTRATHEGKLANGVILDWNGKEVRTDEFTYKIASVLVKLFKDRLNTTQMAPQSYGSQTMIDAIRGLKPWDTFRLVIDADLEKFKIRRKPFLLY